MSYPHPSDSPFAHSVPPLEWAAVASHIETLRTTFPSATRFQEKLNELDSLLKPSWTRLSLHIRSNLEQKNSAIYRDGIAGTRSTANEAMAFVPSNYEIFAELWEKDGFCAWDGKLARSILERALAKISNSAVKHRALRDAVKSAQDIWGGWDALETDRQVRILISLLEFDKQIEAVKSYNKEEHAKRAFPQPPTLEQIRQAALSLKPLQRAEHPENESIEAARRRRREVEFRAGNHKFEGLLHVRPQSPSRYIANARQADSPNPSIFAPPSSASSSHASGALLQHLGSEWNRLDQPHFPLVGYQPQAEQFSPHFNDFTAHGTPAFPPPSAHDPTPHYPSAPYASSSSASRSGVQHVNPQQPSHGSQLDTFDPNYPDFPYYHPQ